MKNSPKDKKRDQIPFNHEFCDSFEQASKFGTYEIQPSNDTDNLYPAISQGLSDKAEKNAKKEQRLWEEGKTKAED